MKQDRISGHIKQSTSGTHHSAGSFTVNLEGRARTLQRVVDLEPHIFLARFLQAATIGSAEKLDYKVTRRGVQIRLTPSDCEPFESAENLLNGNPQDEVQQYLELGLLSARALQPRKLIWAFRGPNGGYAVDLLSAHLGPAPLEAGPAEASLELEWRSSGGWLDALKGFLRKRTEVTVFLYSRCCCSTVPVTVDNWLLSMRTLFSHARPYLSPHFLCYSTRLTGPNQSPAETFNGLGPGCKIAVAAEVEGQKVPELTAKEDIGRIVITNNATSQIASLARVQGKVNMRVKLKEGDPGGPPFALARKMIVTPPDSSGETGLKTLQSLYIEAPDSQLSWSPCSSWTDPFLCGPGFRCSRFLAITKSGRVIGIQPLRTSLVIVKDGLVVEMETPPGWEEGWLAVTAIPDCTMDGDRWRVVRDETYHRLIDDRGRLANTSIRPVTAWVYSGKMGSSCWFTPPILFNSTAAWMGLSPRMGSGTT